MTRHLPESFRTERHATEAARRRGIREQAIDLVLALHDHAVHVGNGREAWSVSRARCRALRAAGLPEPVVGRLGRTILVLEPLTRRIVTVINGHADSHRRYRHGDDGRLAADAFTDPSSDVVQRFLAIHDATFGTGTAAHVGFNNRIKTAQRKDKPRTRQAAMRQIFTEIRSCLDDILEREIPDAMVGQPYAVHRKERGKGQPARFRLILKPEQIEIVGG